MMKSLFFCFLTILPFIPTQAKVETVNLKDVLSKLPERQVSYDLVMALASRQSNMFKLAMADSLSVDAAKLRVTAQFDPRLSLSAGQLDDRSPQQSLLSPVRTESSIYKMGIAKNFSTGTLASLELQSQSLSLTGSRLNTGTATLDAATQDAYYESGSLALSLRQSLWKDAFGQASRSQAEAGSFLTEAARQNVEESLNQFHNQLTQIFYGAWLAQAQERQAKNDLDRQARLLKITEARASRGTAEKPELLQIQSGVRLAQNNLREAQDRLLSIWRDLIVNLGLPGSWMSLDPSQIPLVLDNPTNEAVKLCGENPGHSGPQATAAMQAAEAQKKAAELSLAAAQSRSRPDLYLSLQLKNSGLDSTQSEVQSEMLNGKYPYTFVGVGFEMPIGFNAEKAQVQDALVQKIKAEAFYETKKDEIVSAWLKVCADVKRTQLIRNDLDAAYKMQRERVELEEQRFRLARIQFFQLTQAISEFYQIELLFRKAEVDQRLAAWSVLRMQGQIKHYFEKLAKSNWSIQLE